ncbi:glycosyltransferase family protein [Vibrio alginolyticus]|uniref:hypothetical protein n=1 Tax=Vibrio alginolyticus TaxID=663 RepID=UPI003755133F
MYKINIYTDNAPLSEDVIATGMERVNTRLFKCLNSHIDSIYVSNANKEVYADDIDQDLKIKTQISSLNVINNLLRRIIYKLESNFGFSMDLIFYFIKKKIIKNINDSGCQVLFVPLGADIRGFKRAVEISRSTNSELWVYIVDDFESFSEFKKDKNGLNLCKKIANYLESCTRVLVISQGMKNYIENKYNAKAEVLNLPYDDYNKSVNHEVTSNKEILFLGNLSHFYLDGILDILKVIQYLNDELGYNLKLRLTSACPKEIYENYSSIITVESVAGKDNLHKMISESALCFIPYSFDNKYKTMVTTSFPSKTLECIAHSKSVLVYGPQYSSSIQYFNDNDIATCVSDRSFTLLTEGVVSALNIDMQQLYKNTLITNHSNDYIRSVVLEQA